MNILVEPLYIGLIQTLISFVFISGFIFCGEIINKKIFKDYNNLLFNLLFSVIFFSQIIKIFSYLGFFKQVNLIFSLTIFCLGIYNLKFIYQFINKNEFYLPKNIFEILFLFILFSFFIVSIAPPTMADALDYHYGFSIYLLNFNEVPSPIFGSMVQPQEMVSSLIR